MEISRPERRKTERNGPQVRGALSSGMGKTVSFHNRHLPGRRGSLLTMNRQQYPSSPVNVVPHRGATPPDPGIAVVLEVLPGIMLQTFGIGNIYAGNVGVGVLLMVGYWVLAVLNFLLCFLFIGFITWPLTWVAFMILSPILANGAAKRRALMAPATTHWATRP